jgi:hypothetical protein
MPPAHCGSLQPFIHETELTASTSILEQRLNWLRENGDCRMMPLIARVVAGCSLALCALSATHGQTIIRGRFVWGDAQFL